MTVGIPFTLLFFVALFPQCRSQQFECNPEIETEIWDLSTQDGKRLYLERILEKDQAVRDSEKSAALMLQYGIDSREVMEYVRTQWDQDDINLMKIETYLEVHGYPEKELGEMATTAPLMVIHHARKYAPRKRNFTKVYETYLSGHIDDGAISSYLGRMYEMKEGARLVMESPYTAEEEIAQLIEELDLLEMQRHAEEMNRKKN